VIDCNEWRTQKRHECANMGKVKRLELWWKLYRTSLPVWDLENFRPMDFCWHECTTWHWGAFVQSMLQWKSGKYYVFWVCVCSLGYSACNAHTPYYHLWPAPLYNIFPHYLINGTIFGEKLLNIKCVFWFSLQIMSETFLILRKLNEIWSWTHNGLHVKYRLFLSDFNETWMFSTDFQKILKYQISWKSVQ